MTRARMACGGTLAEMTGPVQVDVYCFTGGTFTSTDNGYISGTAKELPAGGNGSFSVQLLSTITTGPKCTSYLVGSSGYGKLSF